MPAGLNPLGSHLRCGELLLCQELESDVRTCTYGAVEKGFNNGPFPPTKAEGYCSAGDYSNQNLIRYVNMGG